MKKYTFPEDFLWGAATSSHQVEGRNRNDWTEWENAGRVKNNDRSDLAADHWNRYEEDFDILKELNLNAYRLSIEWSRIEPERGKFDASALKHYRQMIEELHVRGITPIVTLHHFTNPVWLPLWTDKSNIQAFNRYCEYVVAGLSDVVDYWCTINEPMNVALLAYSGDIWPPQLKKPLSGLKVAKNFVKAHNLAYETIHRIYREQSLDKPKIGIPLTLPDFEPANGNPLNVFANALIRRLRNNFFLKRVARSLDWVGVNYYHTFKTKWYSVKSFSWVDNDQVDLPRNDMGWNMDPSGLRRVLLHTHKRFSLPMIITENGIADAKDEKREWYITSHLQYLAQAIDEGAYVQGYLHWSLIDNFEWADGYFGRFGLVEVDFISLKRTIRNSAYAYSKIAKSNTLEISEED